MSRYPRKRTSGGQSAYLDDARDLHARACSKTTLQWVRTSMMKIKMWQEPSPTQLASFGLMVKAKGRPNDPGMVVRADVSPLSIRRRAAGVIMLLFGLAAQPGYAAERPRTQLATRSLRQTRHPSPDWNR